MKRYQKYFFMTVTRIIALFAIILLGISCSRPKYVVYEIVKDTLYMKMEDCQSRGKKEYKVYFSKNGKAWEDYVEYNGLIVGDNVNNIYFFPPDTLYILNIEGERLTGLAKKDMEIIDVLSHNLLIFNQDHYELSERLRYESDGKKLERYAPGSPRIANKLTFDSLLTKAPVTISLEPHLMSCTIYDSLGREIPFDLIVH